MRRARRTDRVIETTRPLAITQTNVLHLIRNTFRLAANGIGTPWPKHLRTRYTAVHEAVAKERLVEFPTISGG